MLLSEVLEIPDTLLRRLGNPRGNLNNWGQPFLWLTTARVEIVRRFRESGRMHSLQRVGYIKLSCIRLVMIEKVLKEFKATAYESFIGTYVLKSTVEQLDKQVSSIPTKPSSVFILGMHRSGTSCLTGMLNKYGLYLGRVSQSNKHNQKGNQEGKAAQINKKILSFNEASWSKPHRIEKISYRLRMEIEQYYLQMTIDAYQSGQSKWGTKDPRMLFCLPFWSREDSTFVGTIRHPAKVVSSLLARSKEDEDNLWELWFKYNSELISLYQINRFPIVNFDWEITRYQNAVKNIAQRYLELEEDDCEDFFEESLIHQTRNNDDIEKPKYRNLYSKLVEISEAEEERLQH